MAGSEVATMARRHYFDGRCGDCGHERRVTRVTFWLNGLKMLLCARCVQVYRSVILK